MAQIVRIVHKNEGYRALLTDPAVQADIQARAQRVANAAGEGYEMKASVPRRRARAAVIAVTHEARRDNSANNTLIRSLDAGR